MYRNMLMDRSRELIVDSVLGGEPEESGESGCKGVPGGNKNYSLNGNVGEAIRHAPFNVCSACRPASLGNTTLVPHAETTLEGEQLLDKTLGDTMARI